MIDITLESIEAGLKHLASTQEVSRRELIEGLCGFMHAQKTLRLDQVRPVLERSELGAEGLKEVSSRFFEVAALFIFPGLSCSDDHFAHSFLDIALMAKSFEMGIERSIAEGWGDLSSPSRPNDITAAEIRTTPTSEEIDRLIEPQPENWSVAAVANLHNAFSPEHRPMVIEAMNHATPSERKLELVEELIGLQPKEGEALANVVRYFLALSNSSY
jgi:hypothetical protein